MSARIAPCIACEQGYVYPKHSTRPKPTKCRVCKGRGAVEVVDEDEQAKAAELEEFIAAARKAGAL